MYEFNNKLSIKQPKIIKNFTILFFCCASIKCNKPAKKQTKNVKLELLTMEETFR